MNKYFITLNIASDISKDELSSFFINADFSKFSVIGVDNVTEYYDKNTRKESLKNISDAMKEHKRGLKF